MSEDQHGQQLAEWEQQHESERQEWDELWQRHAQDLTELRAIRRENQNGDSAEKHQRAAQ